MVKGLPRAVKLVALGDFSSHWHVYGGLPPWNETLVVRVEFCPPSMALGLKLIVGAVSTGLTVTSTADEIAFSDTGEASATTAQ